jgi:ADP-ribose pyrophosphatase
MSPNKEVIYEGKFLRFCRVNGWEYVERPNVCGLIAILAITPDDKIVLVEQFRPPVNCRVIEIPAGLAGDHDGAENEDLVEAAKRELLEETGYSAQRWKLLTEGPASAGLSTEVISFYRAYDLKKTGSGGGDSAEDIEVHEVPLRELTAWLAAKQKAGRLVDYKVYASLFFYSILNKTTALIQEKE